MQDEKEIILNITMNNDPEYYYREPKKTEDESQIEDDGEEIDLEEDF